ncbi:MAG: HTTM domain-containing protein [Planctomycetaceae bacterium]|nr:HTTM domain-containing protein [Planctomycetaceae bacterium]MBT6156775.1 HTTM domain-containing protein [Planctomycetaceae bacterium]MBT6487730.1 HTTM domain-containing protein [Planctomycetaceae bacterium]MBT6494177.1 HTTM domain-containing protein [Planctomycetaceae bacterium]
MNDNPDGYEIKLSATSKLQPSRSTGWWSGVVREPCIRELFGIDVRGLALFRVCLAVLLLLDLAGRVPYITAHYTDAGLVSRDLMMGRMGRWTLSLYWMNGTPLFVSLMFTVAAVFALMLLVGYRTRLATVVSWALLVSLHYRNPLVASAGDHVMRLLLFWGMFLPLGVCGSVDSRLRNNNAARQVPYSVLSMATLGLLLQIVFLYVFSAMLKTSPIWRQEGTAIYYALNLDRMTTSFGRWFLEFPELCRLLTFATLGLEVLVPALAFIPWATRYLRTFVVASFYSFHAGLALTMHLILFPFVCMTAWLVFLPPWFWDKVEATRVGSAASIVWESFIGRVAFVVKSFENGSRPPAPIAPHRCSLRLNVVAGLLLLYVLGWNIHSVTKKTDHALPKLARMAGLHETATDAISGIGATLGISQGWIMFSPYPPREDGWWVAEATLADGSIVDLYRNGSDISWEKPASISGEFPSHRCRKYMMSLWSSRRRYHAPHYARWLRSDWNESHDDDRRVESLRLYYMLEYTQPPGEPPVSAKLLVFRWNDSGSEKLVSYRSNKDEYKRLLEKKKR